MHPALSVIFFTTVSGLGYGLMAAAGLAPVLGFTTPHPYFYPITVTIGAVLVSLGLLSSTFHLGHPERAWRAFSQWRSSWLSREGVIAVFAYVPAVVFAVAALTVPDNAVLNAGAGLVLAGFSLLTVYATAMIYASLKAIPAWCNRWVPLVYLSLGLMSGLLCFELIALIAGARSPGTVSACIVAITVAGFIKLHYWRYLRSRVPASTPQTALGLRSGDRISVFESPHSSENFVQREMAFQIARKHADRLRVISLWTAFIIPLVLTLLATTIHPWPLQIALAALALICAAVGIFVERWLFFAEARHVAAYYYGAPAAL